MSLTRVAVVTSPLGDKLLLRSMAGYEELGRAFRFELDLVTKDPDVEFSAVLGQTMTVQLERPDGSTREFTGHVTEFALAGGSGRQVLYRAVLRPWLELLSYHTNCRIFQQLTVPDVVRQIFREAGFSDFEDRLTSTYRTWDYLVQYRESDFAFISRLLEQEGIYYFVKHSAGTHVVILCDAQSAHEPVPGYEKIPYYPPEEQHRDRDHINQWNLTRKIRPGAVASLDFNFTRPRASLLARRVEPDEDVGASYEAFDYPGEYVELAEGDDAVRVRLEAVHAEREWAEGAGDAVGLSVGALFQLDGFPRRDQNKEYLVVRATYQIQVNADESGNGDAGPAFRCQFAAIDASRPFRAAQSTRKPIVEGPQTAIVVGPPGEEIFTDEYARVKVKFHWDRLSPGDQSSSCWVRVSQLWAGTHFGGIHIPRIGQEVIVDFLEGDPDRPIITGRVYNFDNQPPYALPENRTQSGIKSHSTKEGTLANYNELRFEDKLGGELVYMQAEKDLEVLVKNAEFREVVATRLSKIGTNDTLEVGANRSATIGAEDTEAVGQNQSVTIGASQTINVTATRSVTSDVENLTTGTRAKIVNESETTTIGVDRTETVGSNESVTVGGNQVVTVHGRRNQSVDKDDSLGVAGARQQTISLDDRLEVGKRLVISAGDEIVLEAGDATMTLKKNGDIVLRGKNVQVDGSGKIQIKADADVVVKGSRVGGN